MANTKTTTTKTASAKVSTKATKDTPVKKAAVKQVTAKVADNVTAKVETKTASKSHVFALVAGMVRKIEHKAMKQAIKYHVSKGNLTLTDKGAALTTQGATLWGAERVATDPAKFQEVAAFINGKGETPKEWKGQPITHACEGAQFPNMLYWGSFSSGIMRQAFAALWAK